MVVLWWIVVKALLVSFSILPDGTYPKSLDNWFQGSTAVSLSMILLILLLSILADMSRIQYSSPVQILTSRELA